MGVGLTGGLKGGEDGAAAGGELVTVRVDDFENQTMGPQHPQLPADLGGAAALLLGGALGGGMG